MVLSVLLMVKEMSFGHQFQPAENCQSSLQERCHIHFLKSVTTKLAYILILCVFNDKNIVILKNCFGKLAWRVEQQKKYICITSFPYSRRIVYGELPYENSIQAYMTQRILSVDLEI